MLLWCVGLQGFRTIRPNLVVEETIEPTQIAGFTQFLDDLNESTATTYGLGLDIDLGNGTYAGAEVRRRRLTVPGRSPFDGEPAETFRQNERAYEVYLYKALSANWAAGATLQIEEIQTPERGPPFSLKTISLPLDVRYFHESGFFAALGPTVFRQNISSSAKEESSGIVVNAAAGFRLPGRRGLVSLEARNLFNEDFQYQDIAYVTADVNTIPEARFRPRRTILGRLTLNF